jgi:glutaredoxin 3
MADKQATLYRMVLDNHECPFGRRAKEMLEAAGYQVDEHILATRTDVDAYKAKESVATTPQVVIDGKRIGGSDALEAYLA